MTAFAHARIVVPRPISTPLRTTVAPVDYDSAIVARLRDSHGEPCFPQTLSWLLRRQRPDGTWGADRLHAHDRLVSTLAAIRCLHEAQVAPAAVDRALQTIPRLIAHLGEDNNETVGFEVIAPHLLDWCHAAGLPLPTLHLLNGRKQADAAELTAPSMLLLAERQRRTARIAHGITGTIVFSLEGLDTVPPEASRLIAPRGSLLASPSATAAYLDRYPATPQSWAYLAWLAQQNDGGIPAVHPLDSFVSSWSCLYLDLSGQGRSRLAWRLRARAIRSWTAHGASYSDEFPIPNADDTAVNFLIQRNAGLTPDIQVFEPFLTPNGARCYAHEHDTSASANVHVLLALRAAPATPQRDAWIASMLRYLSQVVRQRADGLLADKWHMSPIYTTSHAMLATYGLDEQLWTQLRDALLQAQEPDGAWGAEGGSAEEVAYGLHALCLTDPVRSAAAIRAGAGALRRLRHQPPPSLWIGKCLYLPYQVVARAITAAEILVAAGA